MVLAAPLAVMGYVPTGEARTAVVERFTVRPMEAQGRNKQGRRENFKVGMLRQDKKRCVKLSEPSDLRK